MTDYALKITETVARLQKELKCGICCSTYKDPVLSTCFHIFCRSCLNACFERKRKVQCPICRTVLDKRSCRDSYQLTMAVQNYLKLSEAFKKDITNQAMFSSLPPEKMFIESQVPLDITIIPENDGKRCAPDFAIPLLPVRRKRVSKPAPAPSAEPEALPAPQPEPIFAAPAPPKPIPKPVPPTKTFTNSETETEPFKISANELHAIDIAEHINTLRENLPEIDEIDALFRLIPSMRTLLEKNIELLCEKIPIKIEKTDEKPSTKHVSFAGAVQEETIILKDEEDVEKAPEVEELIQEKKEEVAIEKVKDDEDEVVEDSEGEVVQDNREEEEDVADRTNSTTLDADRTAQATQSEAARIDEELSYVSKTIVCSRIHNDEDEELLSDFYHKFLSNACRFAENVGPHTTHLVMMNSEGRSIPQKSTAYLQAIARKCVVVCRQWFVDCLKTGLLLSEGDYTITSCSSDTLPPTVSPSPPIGWLRSRNDTEGKLFANCRFMILRKFTMNPYFDYKQLIDLVKLCGGEILSCYDNLSPEKLFIIFSKHSKSIDESRNMEKVYKCEVVTIEWVLDSISEYSILPTDEYKAVKLANSILEE